MAKSVLVIECDDHGHFFLSLADGTLTFGDVPGRAEMILRSLSVSHVRCEIEIDDDLVVVSRPPSPTGEPTAQREVHTGQGLRLGPSRLYLEALADDSPDAEAQEQEAPPTAAAPAQPGSPAPALPEGTFKRLRVIDGADLGRAFRLPEDGSVSVGKSAKQADLVLHDLHVSAAHCVIEIDSGKVVVRHNQGDNGTLINGKRITAPQELHLNDVLRVGNSHLRLETALTLGSAPASKEEEGDSELIPRELGGARGRDEPPAGPPHELVGRDFGNYKIVQLLGKGHTSEVFRARDVRNNLSVTLKVLPAAFPADGPELQQFVQALKVVTQLHHPNLVTTYTAGRTNGRCWIAREYVEGQSAAALAIHLAQKGKINWTRSARVAAHLARALNFLHQQRLVHGNVTLANVLLGEDRSSRLADLMLDKALEGSRLQEAVLEQKLLAELPFVAPEQTDPKAFVDNLADLYSLGAVAYVLLTGQPPFAGGSPAEIIERIRKTSVVRPSTHQRGIPPAFETVVLKLLSKHQEDRYQTAAELQSAVEAITEEHKVEV
jgi:pSer/pThr/pTyr-binding forkhead associated (FHA) protein